MRQKLVKELETALLGYVEKYGLSQRATEYFVNRSKHEDNGNPQFKSARSTGQKRQNRESGFVLVRNSVMAVFLDSVRSGSKQPLGPQLALAVGCAIACTSHWRECACIAMRRAAHLWRSVARQPRVLDGCGAQWPARSMRCSARHNCA